MLLGLTFLDINDVQIKVSKGDVEDFAVKIAINKLDISVISNWLSSREM
jgi:prophage maintenance system killer protein